MRELYSALRDANIPEDKALATVLAFEERLKHIDERFNALEQRLSQFEAGFEAKLEKLEHKVTLIATFHTALILLLIGLVLRK